MLMLKIFFYKRIGVKILIVKNISLEVCKK